MVPLRSLAPAMAAVLAAVGLGVLFPASATAVEPSVVEGSTSPGPVTLRQEFSFESGRILRTGRSVRLQIPRDSAVRVSGREGSTALIPAGDIGLRHVPGGAGLAPTEIVVSLPGSRGRLRMLEPKVRVTATSVVMSGTLPAPQRTRPADDPPPGWYEGADGSWYPTPGTVAMLMNVPACAGPYVNTFVTCMGTSFTYTFSSVFTANVNGKSTQVEGVSLMACLPYEYMEDYDDASLSVAPPVSPAYSITLNQDCGSSMIYPYASAQRDPEPTVAVSTSEYTIFGSAFSWGM